MVDAMLFDKIFKREKLTHKSKTDSGNLSVTTPSVQYVHTAGNRKMKQDDVNNVIVLWWISKKKKGYDKTTNKFPKWFMNQYGIDFNQVMCGYLQEGLLEDDNKIVKITQAGKDKLKEYDYIIYIHENPQYCLSISDFENSSNLHRVQNADITWGILNARILQYIQKKMWESAAANYGNLADFLIKEKKYDQAIEFIFATAYLETSGMRDNNELTPIMAECTKSGWKNKRLPNGMPDIFLLEINNYYVTVPFLKAQEALKLEWDEVKKRYLNSAQIRSLETTLPFKYFEKEQSFEIFRQAIEAGGKKGIFPLSDCVRKLKSNMPDEHSEKYFYASVENQVNRRFSTK